jgi:hypothetical protein
MTTPDDGERVYRPERLVVDVIDAAAGATENEVIRSLGYLKDERGLMLHDGPIPSGDTLQMCATSRQ